MPTYDTELSVLDQFMPNCHVGMVMVFATEKPDEAVEHLRKGIDLTAKQLPFLGGTAYEDPKDQYKAKVTWSDDDPKVEFEEVASEGAPTYAELASRNFDIAKFNFDFQTPRFTKSFGAERKPVVVASYCKIKGGLVVLYGAHHSMADGGGQAMLYNLIALNAQGLETTDYKIDPKEPLFRIERMKGLITALLDKEKLAGDNSLGSINAEGHGHYPPAPGFAMSIFRFSVRRLDQLRKEFGKLTNEKVSLNTMVTVLLWSLVCQVRVKRWLSAHGSLKDEWKTSTLVIASNPRDMFEKAGLVEKNTAVGNMAWAVWPFPSIDMNTLEQPPVEIELPAEASQNGTATNGDAPKVRISFPACMPSAMKSMTDNIANRTLGTIAESYNSINTVLETIPGLDLRGPRTLASFTNGLGFSISNWGPLELLPDFGTPLGRPTCVRTSMEMPWDGVAATMPRHYDVSAGPELLDVYDIQLYLRSDDMETLKQMPALTTMLKNKVF